MNKALLAIAILCCCSCDHIETIYGGFSDESINGTHVLKNVWTKAFDLQYYRFRSDKIDKADLLIHCVETIPFDINSNNWIAEDESEAESEDSESFENWDEIEEEVDVRTHSEWIRDWFQAGDKRQLVLILRDGNVAPQLCKMWAKELEQLIQQEPQSDENDDRRKQKQQLINLASSNITEALVSYPDSEDFEFFTVHGREMEQGKQVTGIYNGPAPLTLQTRSTLSASGANTLLSVDRRAFALEIPIDDDRLIVIANATPLLDAALVDHAARDLLDALTAHIQAWDIQHGAWLQYPFPFNNSIKPPNVLAMLFTQRPFNYIIIHTFIFLFAYLFWKACWLGRKRSRRRTVEEQFQRHVEALAFQLRKQKDYVKQDQALARATGKNSNKQAAASDAEALDNIRDMYTKKQKG